MKYTSHAKAAMAVAVLSVAATYATSVETETCLGKPPTTTPSACDRMQAKLKTCSEITRKEDIIICFCNQDMLNAFILYVGDEMLLDPNFIRCSVELGIANLVGVLNSCKGEARECALMYISDADIDVMVEEWQKACKQYLPTSITTPVLTPLSTILDPDSCSSAAQACLMRDRGVSSCKMAFATNTTAALSCLCQSTQLDLASRCQIDGTKCIPTKPVTVTNIWEYKNCQPTGWPVRNPFVSYEF